MATLKHIASKNSDYTAIEAYLVYQHDEFTGKQLLDEQGKPKLRDSYLLDTLECGDFSFATACLLANRKYGKNTQHGDIKSHQYIISFDPRDAADNGLTMEKAQALGLKFCEENFPGHPAIVCTHPDGHNHSGNIHVHIVIGSVRTREVERKPYMQKPRHAHADACAEDGKQTRQAGDQKDLPCFHAACKQVRRPDVQHPDKQRTSRKNHQQNAEKNGGTMITNEKPSSRLV